MIFVTNNHILVQFDKNFVPKKNEMNMIENNDPTILKSDEELRKDEKSLYQTVIF